jgi:seryl-tRNA synthetase
MLDLLLIRAAQGGNPEIVYESQKRRFKSTEIVDNSIELDKKWKAGMNSHLNIYPQ